MTLALALAVLCACTAVVALSLAVLAGRHLLVGHLRWHHERGDR